MTARRVQAAGQLTAKGRLSEALAAKQSSQVAAKLAEGKAASS